MTGSLFRLQLIAALSVAVGLLGVLSSPTRFSASTYDGIRQIGGVHAWSIAIIILGTVLLICLIARAHPGLLALSAVAVATWYGACGGGFILAAAQNDGVAWWGAAFFTYFALVHASLAYTAAIRMTTEE